MADIQLLITDDANRRALASVVETQHTVITASELQSADLHLIDDASLPQYRDAIETYKNDQAPVFCPVILIRRERTPISVTLPTPDPSQRPLLINEIVTAPAKRQTLFRRMANLLVRRQQTTELRDKNERLEQFASTLRHELRNPLNVVEGWLSLARERGATEEAFDRCQTALDQMEHLIEDTTILLEEGDAGIDREPIELAAVCEDCWEMVPDADATLKIESSQELIADEERLRQLLGNVFRNAVEHGGTHVTVTVGESADGFYIADDGPGIPPSDRKKVFEQGYSTDRSGSGLGLAVVDRITTVHDWDLRITDSSTGGTRIEITNVDLQ